MLDKKSYHILKLINKTPNVTLDELNQKFGSFAKDSVSFMLKEGYITSDVISTIPAANGIIEVRSKKYRITPNGISYLEETRKDIIRYWIPIIISNILSLAALIVSIISITSAI